MPVNLPSCQAKLLINIPNITAANFFVNMLMKILDICSFHGHIQATSLTTMQSFFATEAMFNMTISGHIDIQNFAK